ncbi:hypothetical protein DFH09DRAFT_1147311, partial [Mycena vulgaris]
MLTPILIHACLQVHTLQAPVVLTPRSPLRLRPRECARTWPAALRSVPCPPLHERILAQRSGACHSSTPSQAANDARASTRTRGRRVG